MDSTRPARKVQVPRFSLRPAMERDYDFALGLYLESLRELLVSRGRWNQQRFIARFHRAFKPAAAQVILSRGSNIGWMHVSESTNRIHLHHILIAAPFRSRGIGSALLRVLQDRARTKRKPVTLNVMRGNDRAIALYRRLAFRTTGGDEERVRMRWDDWPRLRSSQSPPSRAGQRLRKSIPLRKSMPLRRSMPLRKSAPPPRRTASSRI
jgi:ribosomal protein S18 acetylase RimI-like enzyme